MTWWQSLPAIATAVALFFVPGFILGRSLGAKGFFSVAIAPIASSGLIGVTGIIGGFVHIPFNIWLLLAVTLLCSLLGWLPRRIFAKRFSPVEAIERSTLLTSLTIVASVAAAATLILKRLLPVIPSPDSFAQVYDNLFHLNAIRYILETGNASSLNLGNMPTDGSGISIYPSVWHSLGALVAQLTSVNLFVAENAVMIAVIAIIWPFSVIALVRAIVGPRVVASLVAGIFSAGFWIFPFQTIQFGPLFPNTLSYSLLPVAIMVLAYLLRLTKQRPANDYTLAAMMAVAVTGLVLSQPNGFTALLAFSVPMIASFWVRRVFRASKQKAWKSVGIEIAWGILAVIVFCVLWRAMLLDFDNWKPSMRLRDAVKSVFTGGLMGYFFTWLASFFAAAGLLTILVRRKWWWIPGAMAIAGGLYVVAVWAPNGPFRHLMIGAWYQDPYRLAALVPLFTIVLAAVGADGAVSLIAYLSKLVIKSQKRAENFLTESRQKAITVIGGILVLALGIGILAPLVWNQTTRGMNRVTQKIEISWDYHWVNSPDEYALLKRLDQKVPEDAIVAVDPYNGGTLAYAIAGTKLTQYYLNPPPSSKLRTVAKDLATATPGSETCKLNNELKIEYVLDFGDFYMLNIPEARYYPSFVKIKNNPALELVDQQGDAKLFKIVGC